MTGAKACNVRMHDGRSSSSMAGAGDVEVVSHEREMAERPAAAAAQARRQSSVHAPGA
jgi:hypothetical protein